MKGIYSSIFALFLFMVACHLPDTKVTAATMERYWKFLQVENYDSLKTFYIPKGDNPDEKYKLLSAALHHLYENYGNIRNVSLITQSASSSTNGESIDLLYEVEYDKKVINHEFSFRKDGKGVFRILDHSFNQ